jgi:hypothetical protein
MEAKKLTTKDEDINKIFLAVDNARKKLDKVDDSKIDKFLDDSSELKNLIAPALNTKPKISQTMYANDNEIQNKLAERDVMETFAFPTNKQLLMAVLGTAVLGFAIGAKIGLSVYYETTPYETKVTIIDMVKTLF